MMVCCISIVSKDWSVTDIRIVSDAGARAASDMLQISTFDNHWLAHCLLICDGGQRQDVHDDLQNLLRFRQLKYSSILKGSDYLWLLS